MKSDVKGCSVCAPGEEFYEGYFVGPTYYIQYDYRSLQTHDLFTGVFLSMEAAREKRNTWLERLGLDQ